MSSKRVVTVKYDAKGEHFEIIVDPEYALEFKLGKPISLDKVLITDTVFRDSKRGLRASEIALKRVFGTTDHRKAAEIILRNAEIPLTSEQRRRLIEDKKKQIIDWISRNCIDARTKAPLPPQRIELALNNVDVAIDPFKGVDEQINDVLKALQKVIPIKVAVATLEVTVGPEHGQRVKSALARMGRILKEQYDESGNLILQLEVPAGLQDTVIGKVNEMTHGESEVKLLGVST
ncbi:ribosome assembly factor SBDS [Caldivirga maquilingensis]|uniref:Shwachman-Bodian-Diamond syndrome protein n=1 Tax=Caldivirga maquilingensis (strain ATCC 700844 / DSM 13496 / JCM 10307 / IC-167) TaxID=397948 RepID=A8MAL1_CALMQ|nr:ribosome assembly factor SBDS [Caldivirga maquilingensis]ABW01047.1 Shwachman-Bodian-Diamond syndrome protein [Caldivirga maquilingensis IC-167]